ncbi:MAG: site-specific integrase [Oscillospiraceae bacterium]|nr:site-specific integrase [Oscillospiraceae bacterium]
MASIIKRKSKYSVVYYYFDANGEKRQRWETYDSNKEALKRKAEVEYQIIEGTFIPPTEQTIKGFLIDFVSLYGEKKWGVSAYDTNVRLIDNYINPLIGDEPIQNINTRFVDKFYKELESTKAVETKYHKPKTEYVTAKTIEKIHKLLSCAFRQAVRWELLPKNPFELAMVPKTTYKKRDIWTAEMIRMALNACRDSKLYIAMNLAFACSLRVGEILGLTWDNVHISDAEIAEDNAHVVVEKELERVSKNAIETLSKKDIIFTFPTILSNTSTRLVLKTPKTESSIRRVWLPRTVAFILREWKKSQEELKSFLGDEYADYNLVVALQNGRPCENRVLQKEFDNLKKEAGLPHVVFHSLRHSSTTYKLKLNHGDLKATQGDTGHAQLNMITEVYSHILDEDRKVNAQKFEAAFYSNPDLREVRPPQEENKLDLQTLVAQLQSNPELAAALAQVLNGQKV